MSRGGIYAYFIGSVFPPFAFDPVLNVAITLAAFLGGVGTLWGPIVGAVMIGPVQQYLVLQFGENGLFQIIYGGLFLLVLLLAPEGIVPTMQKTMNALVNRLHGKDRRGKGRLASLQTRGEMEEDAHTSVAGEGSANG